MFKGECIYLLAQVLFWWSCLLYMNFYFLRLDVSQISKQHSFCFWNRMWLANDAFYWTTCCWGVFGRIIFFLRKFTPVGFSWFESVSVDWSWFQPPWGDLFRSTVVVFSHFKLTSYTFSRLQLVSFVYKRFQLVSEGRLSVNFSRQRKSKLWLEFKNSKFQF